MARPRLADAAQVLLEVKACGICGSDLRYYAGENPWALHTLGRSVPNPPDMLLGHEYAGVVVEVAAKEHEHLLGRRVGAQAFRTCGRCDLCRSGHENLCRHTLHIGHAQGWGAIDVYPGAYADYCIAWADLLHPMADHVTFEEEAMRDFLGVAVHAVGRADGLRGGTVLCIGGGPVGLSIGQVAHAAGAERVVLSEIAPVAQHVIARYPELVCVDPRHTQIAAVVGPSGCVAVFDTVGSPETLSLGLAALAPAGTYVNLAVHSVPVAMDALDLGCERTVTTSSNARYRDEREAHELIQHGDVDMTSMVTHRFRLEQYKEAYDLLLAEPKQAYKVVFTPG